MSSIVISGDTSGTITIAAPAVAGTNTITLPAGTGTMTVAGVNSNIVSGTAVASTSGTAIDFTGIPSWVKRITVMLSGVSLSGGANYLLQLGAGSVTTSGYVGSGGYGYQSGSTVAVNTTTGFNIQVAGVSPAASTTHGVIIFTNVSGNIWVASGAGGYSATAFWSSGGSVTLGGTLDRVRITTSNGTDTFDAGSINILYE